MSNNDAGAGGNITSPIDLSGAFHILTSVWNEPNNVLYVDSNQVASGSIAAGLSIQRIILGYSITAGSLCLGDIAEIIIYNIALATVQRLPLEQWLRNKYATP
jgi:hypothetical protein